VSLLTPLSPPRRPGGATAIDEVAPDGGPSAAAATAREPKEGLAYWLAIAGMVMVGASGLRGGTWTVSDFFFSAASGVIIINLLSGARSRLAPPAARANSPTLLIGLMTLTFGGLMATMLRSVDSPGSALAIARIWYITIIWFWTIRSVSISLRAFQRLVLAAAVGATIHAGIGIYQDVSGANAVAPTWGRSVGYSDHFGDLANSIGSAVPFVAMWPAALRGRRFEVLRALALAVMFGGIATTGSMTILGATVVGTLIAIALPRLLHAQPRVRKRDPTVPLVAGGIVVVTLSLGLVQFSVFDRFNELVAGNSGARWSAESRGDMYEVAINGAARSPLVGVGLDDVSGKSADTFTTVTNVDSQHVHSIYLRLLFEAGIFGLLGLLIILFLYSRDLVRIIRMTRGSPITWLPSAIFGSISVIFIAALFGPVIFSRIIWEPIAIASAFVGITKAGALDEYMVKGRPPRPVGAPRPPAQPAPAEP